MDHEVGSWKRAFSVVRVHGPTSYEISFEALGLSLGVNQMWTKKNSHAPKNECVDFKYIYMPKKGIFEKKKKEFKFDHSSVFSWA
jgi:hypothetical protein